MKDADMQMNQRGFTLLEVIFATAMLAIVMVGFGGSLISGLKATNNAYLRNQATIAANEMADRIRANSIGADARNYTWGPAAAGPGGPNCQAVNCNAQQMAQNDLDQWLLGLTTGDLPSAQGQVACLQPAGAVVPCTLYQVSVMWDEKRSGAIGTNCTGALSDLICYRVTFRP